MSKAKSMFLNFNQYFTYIVLFIFCIGGRGAGKTYGFKVRAIKNYLKGGKQFIYMRRYPTDFKPKDGEKSITKFFDDIIENNEFPNHTFEVKAGKFYMDKEVIGYYIALSSQTHYRSTPFPKVTMICYDEFILRVDKGNRYLTNEVKDFLEFYESIARPGIRKDTVRCFFIANNISESNPFFTFFDIRPNTNKEFTKYKGMLVHYVKDLEIFEQKNNSEFYQMLNNTKNGRIYSAYTNENKSMLDNDDFVMTKSKYSTCIFSVFYKDNPYGIWVSYKEGKIWVSDDIDPNCRLTYTLTLEDFKPNTLLIKGSKVNLKFLADNFKNGNVYYENRFLKIIGNEFIKLLL